jgi:translation initiation factor 2 beta subunit (eIF-2beta)/eIF-5
MKEVEIMAQSSCPKCDSHSFEMVEGNPEHSNFRLMYIQCSSCGAVVGVMDYYNIGSKLEELKKKINR